MSVAHPSAASPVRRGLHVLAYANGFTLWHYRSAVGQSEVRASGHFRDADDMLAPGDMLVAAATDGTALLVIDRNLDASPLA